MTIVREARALYEPLSGGDRFRILGRVVLGNFRDLIDCIPVIQGRVLDFGCGHGIFLNLLRSRGKIQAGLGIDVDEKKIALARSRASSGLEFRAADLDSVSGPFAAVFVCDVFYVIPLSEWIPILRRLRDLTQDGGRLVVKTVFKRPNWKHLVGSVQEVLAVKILGITRSSGSGFVYLNPTEWTRILADAGWEIESLTDLNGLFYNHGLLICRKKS